MTEQHIRQCSALRSSLLINQNRDPRWSLSWGCWSRASGKEMLHTGRAPNLSFSSWGKEVCKSKPQVLFYALPLGHQATWPWAPSAMGWEVLFREKWAPNWATSHVWVNDKEEEYILGGEGSVCEGSWNHSKPPVLPARSFNRDTRKHCVCVPSAHFICPSQGILWITFTL